MSKGTCWNKKFVYDFIQLGKMTIYVVHNLDYIMSVCAGIHSRKLSMLHAVPILRFSTIFSAIHIIFLLRGYMGVGLWD